MDKKGILAHIMENHNEFLGAMYGIYRAAQLMFPKEVDLHNAKLFSLRVLRKCLPRKDFEGNDKLMTDFQKEVQNHTLTHTHVYKCVRVKKKHDFLMMIVACVSLFCQIAHEMELPWLLRMDHLEHRLYIERTKGYWLWIGKTNICR